MKPQEDLESRVQELLAFAKEKDIQISACQQLNSQNRLDTIPLYLDTKKYPEIVSLK